MSIFKHLRNAFFPEPTITHLPAAAFDERTANASPACKKLLASIAPISPNNPRSYATLEQFFEGNPDAGSIWVNLESPPKSDNEAYAFLLEQRNRPEVDDIRVLVTQFNEGDDWPFSDTVVVLTSETEATVRDWFAKFPPDEITKGTEAGDMQDAFLELGFDTSKCSVLWYD